MIKAIICPIDFSPAAYNASQYAAKLGQLTGARISFVSVLELTPLEATVSALGGQGRRLTRKGDEIRAKLEDLCRQIYITFGVNTDYEADATAAPFQRVFSGISSHETLVISGTNGSDTLMQQLFGSSSFGILKEWNGSLLLVPENAAYGTLRKIVYVWGEHVSETEHVGVLNEFVKLFDPLLVCLHIAEPGAVVGAGKYEELRRSISEDLNNSHNIVYERVDSENEAESIEKYMRSANADMLAINRSYESANLVLLKKLMARASFPVLIIGTEKGS